MRWLLIVMRVFIGAIFVYAAYTKLRDPWTLFAMSIDAYQMLSDSMVTLVARTLPWFELILGLALIGGIALRWSSSVAAALMLAFFVMMAISYAKGMQIDCGCFGPGEQLGPKTLLRDGALLAVAIALAALSMRRPARAV
jgi:uncharacterized membrane protein YphA (DoxX/SURF4 family)